MDLQEIKDVLKRIKAHKENLFRNKTSEEMTIIENDWLYNFKDYTADDMRNAITLHFSNSEKLPSIYSIKEELRAMNATKQTEIANTKPKREIGFQTIAFETLKALMYRRYCPLVKMGNVNIPKLDYEAMIGSFNHNKFNQRARDYWRKIQFLGVPEVYVEIVINEANIGMLSPQEFFSRVSTVFADMHPKVQEANKLQGKEKMKYWLKTSGLGSVISDVQLKKVA